VLAKVFFWWPGITYVGLTQAVVRLLRTRRHAGTLPFMSLRKGNSMRSLTVSLALVILIVPGSLAYAQGSQPADTPAAVSNVASKEEVNQLRSEVAAQRQTIEELKSLVEKLTAKEQADASQNTARVANLSLKTVAKLTVCSGRGK
jgi:uncharacterized protein YlxW (UPF0749 family)